MATDRLVIAQDRLDIYDAVDLLAACTRVVDYPGCLTIDLCDAERVHAAALQVLLALVVARTAANRLCTWAGISGQFARTLAISGLDVVLRVPVGTAA